MHKRYQEEAESARMVYAHIISLHYSQIFSLQSLQNNSNFWNGQMEEEKALKQLRRNLIPHARAVPNFDHPFLPQKYVIGIFCCFFLDYLSLTCLPRTKMTFKSIYNRSSKHVTRPSYYKLLKGKRVRKMLFPLCSSFSSAAASQMR